MNQTCLRVVFLVILAGFCQVLCAQEVVSPLKVVPWNGHKAATSLTFDDGDPAHLDVVIPELNRRHLHATFFLIANKLDRKDEWRQAIKAGQEIGNHTLDHLHANQLSPTQENAQVVGAQNVLQKEFGIPIYSFAYPFSEESPGLKDWVSKTSFIARGGVPSLASPEDKTLDWYGIPAKTTMTNYPFETYQGWMDEALASGDWLVWMIHGVEGTPWGWQPIPLKTFKQVLDYLQSKDIWVGTFTEVGSYLRAWKIFENATIKTGSSGEVFGWTVPEHCPPNVTLKVRAAQPKATFELWQKGEKILPDGQGIYTISFNQGELTMKQ